MKLIFLITTLVLPPFAHSIAPFIGPMDPWVSCEFMLTREADSRWAVERFNQMARLKPHIMTFHNDAATEKAWEAFGLPKKEKFRLQMVKEGPLHKVLIKHGRKIVSSLTVHFPPIVVWKEFPPSADEVHFDYTLQNENMNHIGLGSVYQKGPLRKYVAYTLGRESEDVKLWVGIDVPCDDLADYSPQVPQYIILKNEELLCRVDLLSTWVK